MREALRGVSGFDGANAPQRAPKHLGLAYGAWGPTGADGKVPDAAREGWLDKLASQVIPPDYGRAYERWENSFSAQDILRVFTFSSRLLVGHGLPSATEVGLTVHQAWGAPMIPGSALKGLCSHYTASVYGPTTPSVEPWSVKGDEFERGYFQGAVWNKDKNRVVAGPGPFHRRMFGAPRTHSDADWRKPESWRETNAEPWQAGAARGRVTFHDALYVPGSAPANPNAPAGSDCPFVADVLTVHQKSYYDAAGSAAQPWPNDYDNPIPVSFLTVRPGAEFLIALSGKEEETALAAYMLGEALSAWGVGGKTSLGYGVAKPFQA